MSDPPKRMWKMVAKFHGFVHICEDDAKVMNPRFLWCYIDEDLQKFMKHIALSLHPKTVAEETLYKWCVHLFGGVCD